MSEKDYITVKGEGNAEVIEKRSRFIASVKPVKSEDEAISYLNSLKQKYWDANHNVYAYIIRENNIMRYSDDGEPSGTAGVPVLEILKKEELCDLICVVTRYFGGTLLGTGGLVHAYSKTAKEGIENAQIINMRLCREIIIECDYNLIGKVQYEISEFDGATAGDAEYSENVKIKAYVREELAEQFKEKLIDKANGNVKTEDIKTLYFED